MIAYGSLVLMALFPIFVGAYRSVTSHKEQKENHVSKFIFFVMLVSDKKAQVLRFRGFFVFFLYI